MILFSIDLFLKNNQKTIIIYQIKMKKNDFPNLFLLNRVNTF